MNTHFVYFVMRMHNISFKKWPYIYAGTLHYSRVPDLPCSNCGDICSHWKKAIDEYLINIYFFLRHKIKYSWYLLTQMTLFLLALHLLRFWAFYSCKYFHTKHISEIWKKTIFKQNNFLRLIDSIFFGRKWKRFSNTCSYMWVHYKLSNKD